MNLRRVAVMLAITAGLVGCGPKPTTPSGEPGSPSASFDGTWTMTKIEVAPGESGPPPDFMEKIVILVKGDRITGRMKDAGDAQYGVFEVNTSANPNTITFTSADEKGDTGPVKRMSFPTAPGKDGQWPEPTEKLEPRPKLKGIFTQDGDTAKLAISSHPDAPVPTDFTPKAAAKKWNDPDATPASTAQTVVIHLQRVKETPEWATKPPEPRPVPTTGFRTKPTGTIPTAKPPAPPPPPPPPMK